MQDGWFKLASSAISALPDDPAQQTYQVFMDTIQEKVTEFLDLPKVRVWADTFVY